MLEIMAPRAGKTTALAVPMVLDAPGAVIATSNKADLVMATHALRAAQGTCWVFDPQGIAHTPQRFSFNPLSQVSTVEATPRDWPGTSSRRSPTPPAAGTSGPTPPTTCSPP